ncbi:hypothetical protein EVG20_g7053 [Dentipellis fragilis]|uniref:Uncharacterized protein n=1 Tax=Dentipellis fragilis TaxID=205917 RepID=A0A4Y9YGI2_9AGAM|nr:hypothetical protein EVG20_g7053 [Dentipellis fragilis]
MQRLTVRSTSPPHSFPDTYNSATATMVTAGALAIQMRMLRDRLGLEHASGTSRSRRQCVAELTGLVTKNTDDSWGACFRAELPITLFHIIRDNHTYDDIDYCLRVVDLFTYIIAPACFGDEATGRAVADCVLAWGDDLWKVLFSVREKIAAGNRANPRLGASFARLVEAYNHLCNRRGSYPKLLETDFGYFAVFTWMHHMKFGKDDTALQTFDSLCRSSSLSDCNSFCKTAMAYFGGPDAVAQRFNYELRQPDLSKENFADCTRALSIFGGLLEDDSIVPALARQDVLKSLYDTLRKQNNSQSDREEWNAIRKLPGLLWYDRFEGVDTDEWLQLYDNVRQFGLTDSIYDPHYAVLDRTVRHYWKPTADILNGYITSGIVARDDRNLVKMLEAWNTLGRTFRLQ